MIRLAREVQSFVALFLLVSAALVSGCASAGGTAGSSDLGSVWYKHPVTGDVKECGGGFYPGVQIRCYNCGKRYLAEGYLEVQKCKEVRAGTPCVTDAERRAAEAAERGEAAEKVVRACGIMATRSRFCPGSRCRTSGRRSEDTTRAKTAKWNSVVLLRSRWSASPTPWTRAGRRGSDRYRYPALTSIATIRVLILTVIGHETRDVFERYNIVSEQDRRDVAARNAGRLPVAVAVGEAKSTTRRKPALRLIKAGS